MQRRQFLTSAAAVTLLSANAVVHGQAQRWTGQALLTDSCFGRSCQAHSSRHQAGHDAGRELYRPLGATGVEVSVIGMGGSHLGQATVDEETAIRLIHEGPRMRLSMEDTSSSRRRLDTTARHLDWLGSDSPAVQQLAPQLPG